MIREAWGLEVIRQGLVYRCSFAGEGAVERDPYDKLLFPVHIQANLEDELVKEALKTVRLSALLICPSTYPPLKEEKKETVSHSYSITLVSHP